MPSSTDEDELHADALTFRNKLSLSTGKISKNYAYQFYHHVIIYKHIWKAHNVSSETESEALA